MQINGQEITLEMVRDDHKLSPEILTKIIELGGNDAISLYAVSNLSCPKETLIKLLQQGKNDNISKCAIYNEHCPKEALEEIVSRGNNDEISLLAADILNGHKEWRKHYEMLKKGK